MPGLTRNLRARALVNALMGEGGVKESVEGFTLAIHDRRREYFLERVPLRHFRSSLSTVLAQLVRTGAPALLYTYVEYRQCAGSRKEGGAGITISTNGRSRNNSAAVSIPS